MDAVSEAKLDGGVLALLPDSKPKLRGGIESSQLFPVNPTSNGYTGLTGSSSIIFDVNSTSADMIDLSRSFVQTEFFIQVQKNGAWGEVLDTDRVALKNAAAALMWNRVNVRVNGTEVNDQAHNESGWGPAAAHFFDKITTKDYGFGQFSRSRVWTADAPNSGNAGDIELGVMNAGATNSVCGFSGSAAGGSAELEGYAFSDEPLQPRDANGAIIDGNRFNWNFNGENETRPCNAAKWALHQHLCHGSATQPSMLVYQPACSLFKQKTPLPAGSRVRVELFKNPVQMWVLSEAITANAAATSITAVRVNYVRSRFWVHRIRPSPDMLSITKEFIEKTPYRFNFIARRCFSDSIAAGESEYRQANILQGPMPSRCWVFLSRGLLSTTASENLRVSPWAMSPKSYVSGVDANGGAGPDHAWANISEISECYIRVGTQQFPLDSYKRTVDERAESFRAYAVYCQAAGKDIVGELQPCLSYQAFYGNYLAFCIDMQGDPENPIASSVMAATSALASTSGLELYLKFTGAVTDPGAEFVSPGMRVAIVAEGPATVQINLQGGVSKLGY